LPDEAEIPRNACVKSFNVVEKQGIIWFWRGKNEEADKNLIPTISNLDRSDFIAIDCAIDLPYDQSYLIENVIDPAHVHISHDGSLGNRQKAQPLEMEILESSIEGIKARYKYTKKANDNWINLDFVAPNLAVYGFTVGNNITVGTALYSIPTSKGYCRLLLRNYSSFFNWKTKLKPRWLSHWENNRILEEDSVFIVAEQSFIESRQESMQKIILPLKTSDVLVVEYRKWLDRYGKNLPFYQGYTTSKLP
jgi:phenylpropionate dioxygenase-like ring-hydroxylating dioxygenase large terminal subunit